MRLIDSSRRGVVQHRRSGKLGLLSGGQRPRILGWYRCPALRFPRRVSNFLSQGICFILGRLILVGQTLDDKYSTHQIQRGEDHPKYKRGTVAPARVKRAADGGSKQSSVRSGEGVVDDG